MLSLSRETLLLIQRFSDTQLCVLCVSPAALLNAVRWDHVVGLAAVRDYELQFQSSSLVVDDTFSDDNVEAIELLREQEREAESEAEGWEALRAWLASHPEYDDSD